MKLVIFLTLLSTTLILAQEFILPDERVVPVLPDDTPVATVRVANDPGQHTKLPVEGSMTPGPKFTFPSDSGSTVQTASLPVSNQNTFVGCTKNYGPLCGSNGKTYNNKCEFTQAQRSLPELTIKKHGVCPYSY